MFADMQGLEILLTIALSLSCLYFITGTFADVLTAYELIKMIKKDKH